MATLDDAIQLVTDRRFAAAMRRTTDDPVEMRVDEIVRRLLDLGAPDEVSARVLITEAAQRFGGNTAVEHYQSGLRAGGPELRSRFRLWMPAAALEDRS